MKRYRVWARLQGNWMLWCSGLAAWQLEVMGIRNSSDVIIEEETATTVAPEERAG